MPFAVTNRTTERNRAGRVPVVRPFIAACHVAGWLVIGKDGFYGGVAGLSGRRPNLWGCVKGSALTFCS